MQIDQARHVLSSRGPFLRASLDEPVEEIQPADPDRMEDDANFYRNNLCFNVEPTKSSPYVSLGTPLIRSENHLFRFFLDGSIRTYHWGEKIEGNKGFPVMFAEVASAIVRRSNDGGQTVSKFRRQLGLLTPPCPPLSDDTWKDIGELKEAFDEIRTYPKVEVVTLARAEEKRDFRTALAGRARFMMHELESDLAAEINEIRSEEESWLIIDGAIKMGSFLKLKNTIGLAKSFSREPVFSINGSRSLKDIVSMLSSLPEGYRTIVFKQKMSEEAGSDAITKSVAFWYVRLRSGRGLQNALQGIVKVEMRLQEDDLDPEAVELVNTLSRALLAEKYVSPYPVPRWHAHIYPIYTAECYIKSSMYSPVYIRGLLSS
jgi:hypothetical protein